MMIRVKLMGMLRSRMPQAGELELTDGATIDQVLAALQIPSQSVHVFTVNGALERDKQRTLVDGDELTVLPPVGGG